MRLMQDVDRSHTSPLLLTTRLSRPCRSPSLLSRRNHTNLELSYSWSNATITLSTATPTRRTAIPELHPYRLGLPGLPQHSPPMTLGSAPGAFPRGGARMMTMAAAPAPMMAKSFGRVAPETVPEGDRMNTLMRIEGRVDVDCDGASHKIGYSYISSSRLLFVGG